MMSSLRPGRARLFRNEQHWFSLWHVMRHDFTCAIRALFVMGEVGSFWRLLWAALIIRPYYYFKYHRHGKTPDMSQSAKPERDSDNG